MVSQKQTILIVEDEILISNALRDKLSSEGFSILEARSGEQGLEVALAKHPDLILLDIILPGINGMEMLNKLRKDAWGKDALVILLTNLNEPVKVSDGLAQNVYDYIVKSDWTLEDIVKKVKEGLGIQ